MWLLVKRFSLLCFSVSFGLLLINTPCFPSLPEQKYYNSFKITVHLLTNPESYIINDDLSKSSTTLHQNDIYLPCLSQSMFEWKIAIKKSVHLRQQKIHRYISQSARYKLKTLVTKPLVEQFLQSALFNISTRPNISYSTIYPRVSTYSITPLECLYIVSLDSLSLP